MALIWTLYGALVFYNFVDAWNTYQGIQAGISEGNPLAAWLFERFGLFEGLLLIKVPMLILIALIIIRIQTKYRFVRK